MASNRADPSVNRWLSPEQAYEHLFCSMPIIASANFAIFFMQLFCHLFYATLGIRLTPDYSLESEKALAAIPAGLPSGIAGTLAISRFGIG